MVRVGQVRQARGRLSVEYRARDQVRLPERVSASRPVAVMVYGPDGCCAALHLDLDVGRGGVAAVDADHAHLTGWLGVLGLRWVEDRSPTGGRHIHLPLVDRMPIDQAKAFVGALAVRYRTVDPMPHASVPSGCITVPGTAHKGGGRRELTIDSARAYEAITTGNDADAVDVLRGELAEQIAIWRRAQHARETTDDAGSSAAAVEVPAGSMSLRMIRLATGRTTWQQTAYSSQSEARQAVITAAVRAGMGLPEIAHQIDRGFWAGLAGAYARYAPHQRRRSLVADIRKAQAFVATTPLPAKTPTQLSGGSRAHRSHTRETKEVTGGGSPGVGSADEHRFIRSWLAALRATESHRFPGSGGLSERFVLRALGAAAHQKGNRRVAYGARSIAVDVATEFGSAAGVLRRLASDPDGWIVKRHDARGRHADTYELRIPSDLREAAGRLRWAKGKTYGLRAAFRDLGRVAAIVFEVIETGRAQTLSQLPAVTGLSDEACRLAVANLDAYELISRRDGDLVAHPDRLTGVASLVGSLEGFQAQLARYRAQRQRWHDYLARFDADRFVDRVHDPATEQSCHTDAPDRPPESRQPSPPPPALITVYVRPGCTDSQATCRALLMTGMQYVVRDITRDHQARVDHKQLGHDTTPVVVTVDGRTWTGHHPALISAVSRDLTPLHPPALIGGHS